MNGFNKMSETLAKVRVPATYSDLTKKYDGAATAVSKVAEYLNHIIRRVFMSELTDIEARILKFIVRHDPANIAEIKKALPDISAVEYRLEVLSAPRLSAELHMPIPNTSCLEEDYENTLGQFGMESKPLGIFHITDYGRKVLQDHEHWVKAHQRELWLENAWSPFIVALLTSIATHYILPKLPLMLAWARDIFSRILLSSR